MNIPINPPENSNRVLSLLRVWKQRLDFVRHKSQFQHYEQAVNKNKSDILQNSGTSAGYTGKERAQINRLHQLPQLRRFLQTNPGEHFCLKLLQSDLILRGYLRNMDRVVDDY